MVLVTAFLLPFASQLFLSVTPIRSLRFCLGRCFDAVLLSLARLPVRVSGDADESCDEQGRRAATDGPFSMCFDKLEDFASTVQQLPLAVQGVQVTLTRGPYPRPGPAP